MIWGEDTRPTRVGGWVCVFVYVCVKRLKWLSNVIYGRTSAALCSVCGKRQASGATAEDKEQNGAVRWPRSAGTEVLPVSEYRQHPNPQRWENGK